MTQKNTEPELMIQLPWTVPQNVQTIVIQPPAKTHMELNASTDKTAISSFSLSVIVALILGGFATWLAYWYGRRSFDLTKQSFDATIKQIKSTENLMLESNKLLIKSQNDLMLKNQKIEYVKIRNENFEKAAIEFIYLSENFSLFILLLESGHSKFIFEKETEIGSYSFDLNAEIKDRFKVVFDAQVRLRFHLRSILDEDDDVKELIAILEAVVTKALILQNYLIENRKDFHNQIKDYKQKIADAELMLNTILKELSILKISN